MTFTYYITVAIFLTQSETVSKTPQPVPTLIAILIQSITVS